LVVTSPITCSGFAGAEAFMRAARCVSSASAAFRRDAIAALMPALASAFTKFWTPMSLRSTRSLVMDTDGMQKIYPMKSRKCLLNRRGRIRGDCDNADCGLPGSDSGRVLWGMKTRRRPASCGNGQSRIQRKTGVTQKD
jgi:hypothetical protein